MLKLVWTWVTAKASRTWIAHGLICATISFLVGFAGKELLERGPLSMALASSVLLVFFTFREMGDEVKHRAEGKWNDPQWLDRVTYAADETGDLTGPLFVFITSWASYFLTTIKGITW